LNVWTLYMLAVVLISLGTLGALGGLLFLGRCAIGFWEGFQMGRSQLEWHRVKCVKCGAELDYSDGVGCKGEIDLHCHGAECQKGSCACMCVGCYRNIPYVDRSALGTRRCEEEP
jgi:hypothetical protein